MTQDYDKLDSAEQADGNLGLLERMYRGKSHESREGTGDDCGNMGLLHQTHGNLTKAEQMYRQALESHEAMESKEGMANDYCNLGLLYQKRGDLEQATVCWKKSLSLYQEAKHPNATVIQQLLNQLTYI